MTLSRSSLLFFDATGFVAAAISPTGGSGFVLDVCKRGYLRLCSSSSVLLETDKNLMNKAPSALPRHRENLATTMLALVPLPAPRELQQYHAAFGKDDHVVACSMAARADLLITLDRKLIAKMEAEDLDIAAITPGDFLQAHLPTHPEFRSIRP